MVVPCQGNFTGFIKDSVLGKSLKLLENLAKVENLLEGRYIFCCYFAVYYCFSNAFSHPDCFSLAYTPSFLFPFVFLSVHAFTYIFILFIYCQHKHILDSYSLKLPYCLSYPTHKITINLI